LSGKFLARAVSFFSMGHAASTPPAADPGIRAGELFEAHGRMVYALCRLILRDSVEAEDAAQQTFLSAYRSLLNGRGPDQPEAWLATIARNECKNRIARRPPASVELLETDGEGGPDPARVLDTRTEFEALCAAVAELPTKQREAIVLREFYGLSYREVAAALGTTGTAVESAIFKSRRSLQERLRPMRDAAGSLVLPLSLQDSLSQLIPGFSQAAAGGGGAALVAKLSVPFGVKALVTGLSVVAVGGTLAAQRPTHHGKPVALPEPLHSLATQPAEAATRPVRTAPSTVHVAHVVHRAPVVHTIAVVARAAPPPPARTHTSGDDARSAERKANDEQPTEHDSGDVARAPVTTEHDDSSSHDESSGDSDGQRVAASEDGSGDASGD
jgi:RNA polymerase sigma factor (sigma-70 family)